MGLFGTAGIRGSVRTVVTPEQLLRVGRAVGVQADRAGGTEFIVGRDGRMTSETLSSALMCGLESAGVSVIDGGEIPTPVLAFASQGRHGAMITASHNPPGDNGLKLFCDGVEYNQRVEGEVTELVESDPPPGTWDTWSSRTASSVLREYFRAVEEYAVRSEFPTKSSRVVVDCGNGVASHATPSVLRRLGVDVTSLNANVDGTFPARKSKPTPESLRDLRAFTRDGSFGFGIAHDGDGDRVAIVNPDGGVVHEDTVLAVLAGHYVEESSELDPVVVTTPNASARVDERVEAAGGRTARAELGGLHEGIASVENDTTESTVVFAGEPWKHIHPEFGGWIDGVVSAVVFTQLVGQAGSIQVLTENISEKPYRKVSVDCPDQHKQSVMDLLSDSLNERFSEAVFDDAFGVRLDFQDGSWVLIRPSGTEACIRIYVESESVDGLIEETRSLVADAVRTVRGQ